MGSGSSNYNDIVINGQDISLDSMDTSWDHGYGDLPVFPFNTGLHMTQLGAYENNRTLKGYINSTLNAIGAHNLMAPQTEQDYIFSHYMGQDTAAVAGDPALLEVLTLKHYYPQPFTLKDEYLFDAVFAHRGVRGGFGNLIFKGSQKGSITSAVFDRGSALSAGTTKGGIAVCQVHTPTGTAATGSVSLSGQPSDADKFTLTIGGVAYAYTFKTNLTPTAGEVKIGTNTADTILNLWYAMIGDPNVSGTKYAAGTVAIPQTGTGVLVLVSVPNGSNVIALTAFNTGTAANSYTLVATVNVSANLAVSGGTMAGGVAGETATSLTLQSSTSSGGSYAAFATFTLDMTTRAAQYILIPTTTTIQEFVKSIITMSGSTMTYKVSLAFAAYAG